MNLYAGLDDDSKQAMLAIVGDLVIANAGEQVTDPKEAIRLIRGCAGVDNQAVARAFMRLHDIAEEMG